MGRIVYNRAIMMQRLFILVALWVLLGSPVLCSAGLLLHPCACDEAGKEDDLCAHETECDEDPCDQLTLVVRAEKTAGPLPEGLPLHAVIPAPAASEAGTPAGTPGRRAALVPSASHSSRGNPLRL
ncbi:MAG: hypothetical protein ABIK65_08990 [Candidatus Eisenbacteria bacterium]